MKGAVLQRGTLGVTGGKEGWEKCSDHYKNHKKGKLTAKPRDGEGGSLTRQSFSVSGLRFQMTLT